MFQRPLICTDLTDSLQRLVGFIPSLVAGGMRHIVFLHVVPLSETAGVPRPDTERIERAQVKLASALKDVPAGVEVKVEVQTGRPVDTILRTAQTYQADGIMVGTQSRNLLTEKMFGSTTTALAEQTTIPLFTLRPQLISTYTSEELHLRCQHLFRGLLLLYDGSDAAKYTVEQVKRLVLHDADRRLRDCSLCWVIEEGGRLELSAQEEQQFVAQTLEPVRHELEAVGVNAKIEVRRGNPIAEVLLAAQELDVSAIALSSNTVSRLLEWSAPSLSNEVLRRSWHPVLYFPPKK